MERKKKPGKGDKSRHLDSVQLSIRKHEQTEKLKEQLLRLYKAWDVEVGGESVLNCLDVTCAVHHSITEYLNFTETRMDESGE
tara:strand:+ start:179 stop:427 length:249 start_codon:yes stop_codon:yes gene_type:complete